METDATTPCSQCLQAAQVTVEDHVLSQHKISPLKVVGYEGLLGGLATVAIVMPVLGMVHGGAKVPGLYEDSIDTLIVRACCHYSPWICILLLLSTDLYIATTHPCHR